MIFSVGNAPTALIAIETLMQKGEIYPALVIGVPVGFVNVVEAKERIMAAKVPYIVAKGRKGGSTVAAIIRSFASTTLTNPTGPPITRAG